jgi:oligoribonuclease
MSTPITRRQAPDNLAWLDLEMTGLDAQTDVIIQAALIITDRDLQPLEEFACDVWQPPEVLARMTPFVRTMHEQTGLLARVARSKVDLVMAERQLLERLAGWCSFPAQLCGNSIATDKRFVERWMPGLARYLHYRLLDVTTLKLLAQRWYGDQAVYTKPAEGEHDALVDIRNSIAELRHYRATLFRGP